MTRAKLVTQVGIRGALLLDAAVLTSPSIEPNEREGNVSKLAPTILSVLTSRLSGKSRSQQAPGSPQAPSHNLAMGQSESVSKKSKKGGKDKDKDVDADSPDLAPGSAQENGHLSPSSTDPTSPPNPSQNGSPSDGTVQSPSITVSGPDGTTFPHNGNGSRPPGTSPVDGPSDQSASNLPNTPSSASKPPPAPVDIPPSQTILSNPNGVHTPNSTGYTPGEPMSLSNGGAAGKDKIRQLDVDDMIQRLLDVGYTGKVSKSLCLKNAEIVAICQAAREIFLNQPTLVELSPPVKIVGDVHGQYSDLIRLFEMCGFPPAANYLFLGDYVDRGKQSLETILLLLCYKIKYPENFFLLRGNHECANVTRGDFHAPLSKNTSDTYNTVYGFYDECKRRCNIKTWKTFVDVFNSLPIAAIVASKIFCVHGGLSPSLHTMDDIKRIQRPTDVPDFGLLNDLLWSDPSDTALDWEENERGVSFCFGKAVINDFLVRYDMDLICRAHMVVEDGYEFWNDRTLVTVFSAPNYCGGELLLDRPFVILRSSLTCPPRI